MNNKDSKARLAKNTLLLYVRQIFVLALSLYTSRLTLQVLGETDYGIYAAVGGVTALLSVITSSLASGTQRFMTFELGSGNAIKLNQVYCTSMQIHFGLCLLLLLIGESVGTWFVFNKMSIPCDRVWIAFCVFQFTLAVSVLSLTNVPNNASIIAHEDMGVYALLSIWDAILKLAFVIILFFISIDRLLAYAFFLFVIQLLSRCVSEVWCRIKYNECHYKFTWNIKLLKEMLGLSGWTGLSTLSISVFIQSVNVLLNIFFGPVMNAAYSVAMQAYSGLRSFCSGFQLASNPQIVKSYSYGDYEQMRSLLFSVCRISFYLIFIISLPFLLNAHYVLQIWLKVVPDHADSFFCLLVVYAYFDVLAYPLDVAAQATGKLKVYTSLTSLCTLAVLPISYLCYLCGAVPESIYIIAIIFSIINVFVRIVCLNRIMVIGLNRFLLDVIMRIIFVFFFGSAIPFALSFFLKESFLSFCALIFVSLISSTIVILRFGMFRSEREYVFTIAKKKYRNIWGNK